MRRLCVYCGSHTGQDPAHAEAARAVGRLLLEQGLGLVYGGGKVGLMGLVADTVLEGGGEVLGVIPQELYEREVGHEGCSELHVVESMHQRKTLMASLADGFLALPGGMGTLEEITEALTWTQLGVHAKPCGLLDVGGFWRPLLEQLDRFVEQGFLKAAFRENVQVGDDPAALLAALRAWRPAGMPRWRTGAVGEDG